MSVEIVNYSESIVALQEQLKMKDELLMMKEKEILDLKEMVLNFTNSIKKSFNHLTLFDNIEPMEMPKKKSAKKVASDETSVASGDKPKRKYTKKPKTEETIVSAPVIADVEEPVVEEVETPVIETPVIVAEEPKRKNTKKPKTPVVEGEEASVGEKPKRKYTKKPKQDSLTNIVSVPEADSNTIDNDDSNEGASTDKPKSKSTKKTKVADDGSVASTDKPKRKYTKKPKAESESVADEGSVGEKPKRKYTKKPKAEVQVEVVVPKEEPIVIHDELVQETYEEDDQDADVNAEEFEHNGVMYWKDAENQLYDINTLVPCGKYNAENNTIEL
jgi:hypothetical protein